MTPGLSRAERRCETKDGAYLRGMIDGARILTDKLREAYSTHPAECGCQSCQLLAYIAGGPRPDWVHDAPNIDSLVTRPV